jgi:hypothetical protein
MKNGLLRSSVVDRQLFDSDPDPNFLVEADPVPDPDLHQNDANPRADPTPSFHMLENQDYKKTFSLSHIIAGFQCSIFSIRIRCVINFSNLNSIEILWNKFSYQLFHLLAIDIDPDQHALDSFPDPAN